jgi:transcription termination factor NusB
MSQEGDSFTTRQRILLIQLIYSTLIAEVQEKELIEYLKKSALFSRYNKTDKLEKDLTIALSIVAKTPELSEIIEKFADIQPPLLVLALLRVGLYELYYCAANHNRGNIIKDYLNIASAFEHQTEIGFINSILDKAKISFSDDVSQK